jgi:hypothetical protein
LFLFFVRGGEKGAGATASSTVATNAHMLRRTCGSQKIQRRKVVVKKGRGRVHRQGGGEGVAEGEVAIGCRKEVSCCHELARIIIRMTGSTAGSGTCGADSSEHVHKGRHEQQQLPHGVDKAHVAPAAPRSGQQMHAGSLPQHHLFTKPLGILSCCALSSCPFCSSLAHWQSAAPDADIRGIQKRKAVALPMACSCSLGASAAEGGGDGRRGWE